MSESKDWTSRLPGFYERALSERLSLLATRGMLSPEAVEHLSSSSEEANRTADSMSENVVGCQALPFALGLNFRVNHRDAIVPMSVEEPSVVAAASNAARLVRLSGGFTGEADPPIMTAQIQLDEVPEVEVAKARILAAKEDLLREADRAIPRMVARGGGCRDLEVRVLEAAEGMMVVHVYVDVGEAMGANLVDTVAEHIAPHLQALTGGLIGLRILSNLPLRRMVRARAVVSADAVGGPSAVDRIVRASRFAELDVFRAVTHNKGILNGIDAAAVALGQDWRAIEAGAHAYASLSGQYRPLATWRAVEQGLEGRIELPLAVGTVGGATRIHRGVRAALELVRAADARELAVILASVGLASNLAALKALTGEGIQKGHMRLHRKKEGASVDPSTDAREAR